MLDGKTAQTKTASVLSRKLEMIFLTPKYNCAERPATST